VGLTTFRRKNLIRTNPRYRPIFGRCTQFSNLLDGLEGAEICDFRGPVKVKWLTTSEDPMFLGENKNTAGTKGVLNPIYCCLVQTKSVVKNNSNGSSEV